MAIVAGVVWGILLGSSGDFCWGRLWMGIPAGVVCGFGLGSFDKKISRVARVWRFLLGSSGDVVGVLWGFLLGSSVDVVKVVWAFLLGSPGDPCWGRLRIWAGVV